MLASTFLSILSVATLSQAVAIPSANPEAELETRAQKCKTIHKGKLSGNGFTFTLNSQNELAYTDGKTKPLSVEFQDCGTTQSGFPAGYKEGRLYVPSSGKCVYITNQSNLFNGPYFAATHSCSSKLTDAERWLWIGNANKDLYWKGLDGSESGEPQGGDGCGLQGYELKNGKPRTKSDGQIYLNCYGSNAPAFHLT